MGDVVNRPGGVHLGHKLHVLQPSWNVTFPVLSTIPSPPNYY